MKPFQCLLLAAVLMLAAVIPASAQHVWTDSLAISTAATDSMFRYPWRTVKIMPDNCDMLIRVGAPDTSSWRTRKWILVPDGQTFEFSATNFMLRRLQWKAVSGSGTLYISGIKVTSQF